MNELQHATADKLFKSANLRHGFQLVEVARSATPSMMNFSKVSVAVELWEDDADGNPTSVDEWTLTEVAAS